MSEKQRQRHQIGVCVCVCVCVRACSVMSDSLQPHACPWDFPDKNTGVGYYSLLHQIRVITEKSRVLQPKKKKGRGAKEEHIESQSV